MSELKRSAEWMSVLVLAGALAGLAGPQGHAGPAVTREQGTFVHDGVAFSVGGLSEHVWRSALDGDREPLDLFLDRVPETVDGQSINTVREAFAQYRENGANAEAAREARRAEALTKLQTHLTEQKLLQAMRDAVEVQSLGDDLDAALTLPEIQDVMARAEGELVAAEREGDWLYAQELLYRLRTLYEDTGNFEAYQTYDERFEQVTQRVASLAEYAPRLLHELRGKQAERLGEEPLKPFNEAMAHDWEERVQGIDHRMLWPGLQRAARDHIETPGWRPLLTGGIESLRTLTTTPALEETFPALADQGKVNKWVAELDRQLAAAKTLPDRMLTVRARAIFDSIVKMNRETIELPQSVLCREFGDGALGDLDEYSEVIWPYKLRRFIQATEGHFVGVGILIRHDDKREIMVIRPLEGSPAYFSGVKPEDRIVEVDGQTTAGWTLNDAVDRITGPRGKAVTLGLRRDGEQDLVNVTIVRDDIKIYSVTGWRKTGLNAKGVPLWDWFIDPGSRIGYVYLSDFNEDTPEDLRAAWEEMTDGGKRSVNGLVLDLRYNPGGLLTSAVAVSNLFLSEGLIVKGEDRNRAEQWVHEAEPQRASIGAGHVPTVVLINKGSASASEIVAGCLQAHGAAVVIGERSFGKGSVQTVHPIAEDALLKLTTQYYRLPPEIGETEGRLVHKRPGATVWGVDPDLLVHMTPDQIEKSLELRQAADLIDLPGAEPKERPNVDELVTKGIDPQLETALLLLRVRALGESEVRHASLN